MPKKLLVADKSVVIQKAVAITFAQEDFEVTFANDGNETINKAKQLRPDLALIHTGIPSRNGYDVCAAFRKDAALAQTPVLLMVGTQEPYDEAKGRSVGANGYIVKPFESQALINRVQETLSAKPAAAAPPPQRPAAAAPPQQAARPSRPPPPASSGAASPASTIAGQVPPRPKPVAEPARAAAAPTPMLDLDMDFGGEVPGIIEEPLPTAAPADVGMAFPEDTATLPADDFWDFSSTTADDDKDATMRIEAPEEAPPAMPDAEPAFAETFVIEATPQAAADEEPAFAEPSMFEMTPEAGPASVGDTAFEFDTAPPESTFEFDPSVLDSTEPFPIVPVAEEISPIATIAGEETPFGTALGAALSQDQIEAVVTKVFRQVIERIAWEVVPDMAETIIKEELSRLIKDTP